MKTLHLCTLLLTTAGLTVSACRKSPTEPSLPAPPTSTLTFQVAAAPGNDAASGSYTTANATFAASVRTNCVPNPVYGTVCPDLLVNVFGNDGRHSCGMWAFAPIGATFGVGNYPKAARFATSDTAAFDLNCSVAGTTCNSSVSSFTVYQLQSNRDGVVTRLHITFEQTCLGGYPEHVGPFGKATGEIWIIDGTTPAPGVP